MGMIKTINFSPDGQVVSESVTGSPTVVNKEQVHHCPRCGSYFYGRFEGFDGNPFLCGNCGFTYPELTIEQLRSMHEKNGTLAKFDAGELIEEVGSYDVKVG